MVRAFVDMKISAYPLPSGFGIITCAQTSFKAAQSVTFDILILEIKFLFFKNTVKNIQIQVNMLPFS